MHVMLSKISRNQYSGVTQFGNLISSQFTGNMNNSSQFILPPEVLHLSKYKKQLILKESNQSQIIHFILPDFWTGKPTFGFSLTFKSLSGQVGDITSVLSQSGTNLSTTSQNRSSYITPCASTDSNPLHDTCEYSNTFQILYDLEESKFSLVRKYSSARYFVSIVSILKSKSVVPKLYLLADQFLVHAEFSFLLP